MAQMSFFLGVLSNHVVTAGGEIPLYIKLLQMAWAKDYSVVINRLHMIYSPIASLAYNIAKQTGFRYEVVSFSAYY